MSPGIHTDPDSDSLVPTHGSSESNGGTLENHQESDSAATDTDQASGTSEAANVESLVPNFKSQGVVSLSYQEIEKGWVTILVGGVPFLRINLIWVLQHLSRNSRKSLSKALTHKEFSTDPSWPLSSQQSNAGDSAGTGVLSPQVAPSPDTSQISESSGKEGAQRIWESRAFQGFVMKLLKNSCALSNPHQHSSSVYDSLRIWLSKNQKIYLYIPTPSKNNPNVLGRVVLDQEVSGIVANMKSLRVSRRRANPQGGSSEGAHKRR